MKPNYQRYYVKYMIKKPILFYSFLFLGVVGFIFGSMNIQMDIRKSYPAEYVEGQLIIFTEEVFEPQEVFLYTDKNDSVERYIVKEGRKEDGKLVLILEEPPQQKEEAFIAEFTVGTESLLYRIFVKAGRA